MVDHGDGSPSDTSGAGFSTRYYGKATRRRQIDSGIRLGYDRRTHPKLDQGDPPDMSAILGSGDFKYEHLVDWHRLPGDANLVEVPGVAVDSSDQVYVFSRNPQQPVMVFDRDGNFLRGFGEGIFSNRTHGILIGPDDSVYCVDNGDHTVRKFTPDGKLLMTLGEPGQPATPLHAR